MFSVSRKSHQILCWDLRYGGTTFHSFYRPGRTNQKINFDIDWAGVNLISGATVSGYAPQVSWIRLPVSHLVSRSLPDRTGRSDFIAWRISINQLKSSRSIPVRGCTTLCYITKSCTPPILQVPFRLRTNKLKKKTAGGTKYVACRIWSYSPPRELTENFFLTPFMREYVQIPSARLPSILRLRRP